MNSNRISGAFLFKFIERSAVKILGLLIGVVLARLLEPAIFGILAVITIFINLANTFMLSGFSTALIQNKTADHKDYSTVFFITTLIGFALIIIIWMISPFIAKFYKMNEIILPLRIMALSLIPGSLNAVQSAKLQREIRFKEMMICNLISTTIAGVVGVSIALTYPSVWALVVYQCSNIIILSLLMLPITGWYPKLEFSFERAKEYFSFGIKILISSLINSLYTDIRSLIIGGRYSTTELAFYNKAQQFPDTIATTIDNSLSTVLLSALSSIQERKEEMRYLTLKTVRISEFFMIPMMLGLASISDTLIPLLLTDKWNRSIVLLKFFCYANVTMPITTASLCFIKATGRSGLYLAAEIIRKIMMLIILLFTVFCIDTVNAITIGYSISLWLDTAIIIYVSKFCGGPELREYIMQNWKVLFSGILMFIGVAALSTLRLLPVIKLLVQIMCGVVIYICITIVLKDTVALKLIGSTVSKLRKRL